jgi:NAD(P)-dependent dehydrogenase (short-subunit alcohol dehydrogenase family)
VLVTGGGSDIGRAIAARRVERGDDVVITASSDASLARALGRLAGHGRQARGVVFDLGRPEASSDALDALGGVDALVLNAWTRRPPVRRFHELPATSLAEDVQRNVLGNCWLVQRVLPGMLQRGFGRIVFVSSVSTALGTARYGSYVLGKSAIEGLMRNLAVEYGAHDVLANTVRLGIFKTERTRRFWGDAAYVARMSAVIPGGALGEPHQVSSVLDPLLAEDQYVNGAVIDVSGGLPMFRLDQVVSS